MTDPERRVKESTPLIILLVSVHISYEVRCNLFFLNKYSRILGARIMLVTAEGKCNNLFANFK
jgi:hypothetical protein